MSGPTINDQVNSRMARALNSIAGRTSTWPGGEWKDVAYWMQATAVYGLDGQYPNPGISLPHTKLPWSLVAGRTLVDDDGNIIVTGHSRRFLGDQSVDNRQERVEAAAPTLIAPIQADENIKFVERAVARYEDLVHSLGVLVSVNGSLTDHAVQDGETIDTLLAACNAALLALDQASFNSLDATGDHAKRLLRDALELRQQPIPTHKVEAKNDA